MNVIYILFACLFFLSTSRDIIRDLPYNIYQIEDMNQYETKYLPEGNKFYIRFPSNLDKDIIFHLTIPKNTTLFPVYSSDFSKYPNDDEVIKAEYQNEIQLKNREDEEYSIYSFDIKKTNTYKVLYFQNNEVLNYLSFYASSLGSTIQIIDRIVPYDQKILLGRLNATTQYFVRVQLDPDDEKLAIETKTTYNDYPDYFLGVAFFPQKPTDDELSYERNYEILAYDSTTYSGSETRIFYTTNKAKSTYLGILIDNSKYLRSFEIIVGHDGRWPTWLIAVISVVVGLIIIVFLFFCLRTEGGRAACLCVLGICLICCSNSGRRH